MDRTTDRQPDAESVTALAVAVIGTRTPPLIAARHDVISRLGILDA